MARSVDLRHDRTLAYCKEAERGYAASMSAPGLSAGDLQGCTACRFCRLHVDTGARSEPSPTLSANASSAASPAASELRCPPHYAELSNPDGTCGETRDRIGMSSILFTELEIQLWRQFDAVKIGFHPRLTVITGANGSGKSTLLTILSQHFGWSKPHLATPRKSNDGSISYLTGLVADLLKRFEIRRQQPTAIGALSYNNGVRSGIFLNETNSFAFSINISQQQPIDGLLIDSHRPSAYYSQIGTIPLTPMTGSQSFNNYNSEMISRYGGGYTGSSPVHRMKESLISMGIFGEGNATLGGSNQGILDTYRGFNEVLRNLLPESLGFKEIAIRSPEVVLVTDSGEFMLDASSGGIMTIIDVAWRIYMYSRDKQDFVVVMDEPENHLHPSMQRTLMRRLLKSFPKAQFIIATHSPFMVSSVRDSDVYVLRYRPAEGDKSLAADVGLAAGRKVVSEKLSRTNKAANAGEVLREVLGVPATMPEWVEEELDQTIDRYRGQKLSSELLDNLRSELSTLGYDEYYPDALGRLTHVQ